MRRWLLILMIVFTPLRGMAADLMALAMAIQAVPAAQPAAAPAGEPASLALHADCAGHGETAAAAEPEHSTTQPPAGNHCKTCASCMVCSSVALAMPSPVTPAGQAGHRVPPPGGAIFSSAEPLRGLKPPIS